MKTKVFIQLKRTAQLVILLLAVCFAMNNALASNLSISEPIHRTSVTSLSGQQFNSVKQRNNKAIYYGGQRYSQNDRGQLRSRSEIVSEVKRRYNGKVLKITLNQQKTMYIVRVYMPNGKVRTIQINAKK